MRAGETPALPIPAETELLLTSRSFFNFPDMSTVAEIEEALNNLPETEFEEVAFVVLERLRKANHRPPFRTFSESQIRGWIEEDERDMVAIRAGQ